MQVPLTLYHDLSTAHLMCPHIQHVPILYTLVRRPLREPLQGVDRRMNHRTPKVEITRGVPHQGWVSDSAGNSPELAASSFHNVGRAGPTGCGRTDT